MTTPAVTTTDVSTATTAASTANAVEIRGLVKRYPGFTLGPVDLTVPTGSIYGLIGPNGAGKTTTLDLIFGLTDPEAGSISVLGLDSRRDEVAMKLQVGYVSPGIHLHSWGTVGKAISFVRSFYQTWDHDYCEYLMTTFGLGWGDAIATLSLGGPIKLKLLLALAWRPRLLVLDEPTVGLDAVVKREVFGELLSAVQNGDRTVLISSHGLGDLERFADHVGMIKKGRMILEGPTSTITEQYCLVDLVADSSVAPQTMAGRPGMTVQSRNDNRWRVLVDRTKVDLTRLGDGVKVVAEAPVTLEELFVALAEEQQ